jgi:hypothetical protein
MPRSKRVRQRTVPKAQPVRLDSLARREIAQYLLGDRRARLSDDVAEGIAYALGSHLAAHEAGLWPGHTPRANADALRRVVESVDRARTEMCILIEPSDIDDETAEMLRNDAEALTAAMQGFRERLLARVTTLDAMQPIRPEHEAMTQTVGWLRLIFQTFAAPHVRDNEANLRGFVIACLDARGIETSNLKEHPDRLREMLRAKVLLPTPDWPQTPGVVT